MLTALRRGVAAGAAGGALAGLFGYLLAEPLMDRAVRLEQSRAPAAQAFSRHTQHLGLIVATVVTGIALGVLLSVAYALVHRGDRKGDAWASSLRFGAGAWFALSVVVFVRYPANPPGVGDAGTIGLRTHTYLATLVVGLIGAALAGRAAQDLHRRGARASTRQLVVAAIVVVTLALPFALPADRDPLDVPADLLWEFRLLAFATAALLWGGLTVVFGLLNQRDAIPKR